MGPSPTLGHGRTPKTTNGILTEPLPVPPGGGSVALRSETFQILRCSLDPFRIVCETPKTMVAARAQELADLSGLVIVVHVQHATLPRTRRVSLASADCTPAFLLLEHALVLFWCYSVTLPERPVSSALLAQTAARIEVSWRLFKIAPLACLLGASPTINAHRCVWSAEFGGRFRLLAPLAQHFCRPYTCHDQPL